jgi:hypothetical protein
MCERQGKHNATRLDKDSRKSRTLHLEMFERQQLKGLDRRTQSQLLVTANVVPRSRIFVTLKMEARISSKTTVHTRTTWRNIPEDGILHVHYLVQDNP